MLPALLSLLGIAEQLPNSRIYCYLVYKGKWLSMLGSPHVNGQNCMSVCICLFLGGIVPRVSLYVAFSMPSCGASRTRVERHSIQIQRTLILLESITRTSGYSCTSSKPAEHQSLLHACLEQGTLRTNVSIISGWPVYGGKDFHKQFVPGISVTQLVLPFPFPSVFSTPRHYLTCLYLVCLTSQVLTCCRQQMNRFYPPQLI